MIGTRALLALALGITLSSASEDRPSSGIIPNEIEKSLLSYGPSMKFEIPPLVKNSLIRKDPLDFLSGSCLQTHQGYKDGTRMHELVHVLGSESFDAIVEYVLFDFATGNCQWVRMMDDQCIWSEWAYALHTDENVFAGSSPLANQVSDWFGWYLEGSSSEILLDDSMIQFKSGMMDELLSLKSKDSLVSEFPWASSHMEGPPLSEQMAEKHDSKCGILNPVAFFGHRWTKISKFLQNNHASDVTSPDQLKKPKKVAHHNKLKSEDSPSPMMQSRLKMVVEFCHQKICFRVGAGFSWNVKDPQENAHIHWNYGVASQSDRPANVRLNLAFLCTDDLDSSFDSSPLFEYGLIDGEPSSQIQFGWLFNDQNEFQGISFETIMGYTDLESKRVRLDPGFLEDGGDSQKIHVSWSHDFKIASYVPDTPNECTLTGKFALSDEEAQRAMPLEISSESICEMAYGKTLDEMDSVKSKCILDIRKIPQGKRTWGWAIQVPSNYDGSIISGELHASAVNCNVDEGLLAGVFQLSRLDNCKIKLSVDLKDGFKMNELNLNYGDNPYAFNFNGAKSVQPQFFSKNHDNLGNVLSFLYIYDDFCHLEGGEGSSQSKSSSNQWILIHANVCISPEARDALAITKKASVFAEQQRRQISEKFDVEMLDQDKVEKDRQQNKKTHHDSHHHKWIYWVVSLILFLVATIELVWRRKCAMFKGFDHVIFANDGESLPLLLRADGDGGSDGSGNGQNGLDSSIKSIYSQNDEYGLLPEQLL